MADAVDSKSTVRKGVWVRLPPRAPESDSNFDSKVPMPQPRSRSAIEKKLAQVGNELQVAREDLRVIDEQMAHFSDEAEDLRLRALVSETPLAAREHRDAARTVSGVQKDRDSKIARITKLEESQDMLLDRLNEVSS